MDKSYIILIIGVLTLAGIGFDSYQSRSLVQDVLSSEQNNNTIVKETNIPTISLDLGKEIIKNVTRDQYIPITLTVNNVTTGEVFSWVSAQLKGRGHGSRTFQKKWYRIKFDEKKGFFWWEPNKNRVLVAANQDRSLMKNNIAYTIVNKILNNIEYTTPVHIVEVYINREYRWVYSLFEHIRVDKGRIDIESNFEDEDTGYLLEYDNYIINEWKKDRDYVTIPGLKYAFEIKSPDPKDYLKKSTPQRYAKQVNFIKTYLNNTIQAILNKDFTTFESLADVPSFVDMYIIHELMKNTDTGRSSFYLYKKPGGKLYAWPARDFDSSSQATNSESSYTGLYVSDTIQEFSPTTSSEIYISLMQQPEFIRLVKARVQEITPSLLLTINHFFKDIEIYDEAFQRNSLRWTAQDNSYLHYQSELYNRLIQRAIRFNQWAENSLID